ncbi:MAG: exodeoxyribonuclease VII large subunit [Aquabacterium sp.]|nr:MAG: exodeoxyribonuclease VII large subunit [Aquabacterium sp.]
MRPTDDLPSPLRPRVWGVSALLHAIGDSLAVRFGTCAVRGEIGGFTRAASGHCYFQLKDPRGQAGLRCVMFRRVADGLQFRPAEGWDVEVQGQLSLYEPRGELQFVVEAMRPAGSGSLYEQFLRLKAKLEAEGLFDPERKRPITAHPRCIGIVSSTAAAALRDVLVTLARRAPHVRVVVYPCMVQGAEAPAQIVQALADAARRGEADTLLVCRGGGSLEDLWAFNDEQVVRAIAASPIPVICGVGHETDTTLADFAADHRAPTPTAAAEMAARARDQLEAELDAIERALLARLVRTLDGASQRLDRAALRLLRPAQVLASHGQHLVHVQQRLVRAGRQLRQRQDERLGQLATRMQREAGRVPQEARRALDGIGHRLRALDPARVLERGYAWLVDGQGRPLTRAGSAAPGQRLTARLADGSIDADVVSVRPAASDQA